VLPSVLILALALYPVVGLAAPVVFFSLWPAKRPPVADLAAGAKSAAEQAAMTRLGVSLPLFLYGSLVGGTLLWELLFPASLDRVGFHTNRWLSTTLLGGYLGVSWAGISIWLLALGAATGRMRREIPGLMAPLRMQIAVWLAGAFAEETWRVVAIAALLASQYSPLFSVVAASLAFGSAYFGQGLQRTAVASLEGAFFGLLFLWQGSFLAPFAAHLAVQAVYLWGVGQFSQDRQSRSTWQIPGTRCPVCGTPLRLLQIKLGEGFECPACKQTLSLSDGYRNAMRFAAALGFLFLTLFSVILLGDLLPGNLAYWFLYPVSYGAATSGIFLYRRAFTRLFPPRLQRGAPYFVALNLKGHLPKSGSGEDKTV
jgi:Type II CAAX prenyl endopeptidase Rce1-like